MRITIVNLNAIRPEDFRSALAALRTQVHRDFAPEWGTDATLRGVRRTIDGSVPIEGIHDAIIYVGNSSSDPTTGVENALGYHTDNHEGIPYGFVYLDVVEQFGEAWTTTLSHEVLELLADPSAALSVVGPAPNGGGSVHRDLEVCDPTQGDFYEIDGVRVSNFVNRSYFGLSGGGPATNFMDLDLSAFGVRPGGYFQYEDGDQVLQVQGEEARKDSRKAMGREAMGLGRRVARRKEKWAPRAKR